MRTKIHWYGRIILMILLFVLATLIFGFSGPFGQLGKLSLQVYSLFSGTYSQGTFNENTITYAEGLIPMIILLIVNLIVYYTLAEIIFLLTGLFFKKKK